MSKKNKKKSKKKNNTFTILLLLILIIAATLYDLYLNSGNGEYVKFIKRYMSCIEKEQYEEMYEMLTDESKEKISREYFIERNKNIYSGIEAKDIKISNISVNMEKNNITYKTTMNTLAGKLQFINTVLIESEIENTYKINWNSTVIFPDLKDENYKVKVTTNNARRGSILDRNNEVLAYDGKAYLVGLVPGKMSKNNIEDINKISELLGIKTEYIKEQLSQEYVGDGTFVPIKTIEKEETKLKEELLKIKGIMITDKNVRIYPYGEATSHLLGYVQSIGKTGVELEFEDELHGIDGYEIYIENQNGYKVKTIISKKAKDGKDIKLTIDSKVQKEVYEKFSVDKSASIVINPSTGEILALVSTPTYNSNNFSFGMTNEMWNDLNNNDEKLLFNRFMATYVPGSIFKPIIGAIGLSENIFSAEDEFEKSGTEWKKDDSWGDFKITTLDEYKEPSNLENAMVYSDNIYFAKAALKIGNSLIEKYAKKLGFGEKLNVFSNLGVSQISNNGKIDSEKQLASTGYGQAEVLMNPIFVASIYSSFLNDGNMIKPYLEYKNKINIEYLKKEVFTKEAANIIKESLIQTVQNPNGTGRNAKIDGITIGGKTGTAEIKESQEDTNGTEIGWFAAFTIDEMNNNQMLIVTLVEDVKEKDGSHYVVTKVRDIIEDLQ